MVVDATSGLFFDASCLFVAADNPSGASGFLLSLCQRHLLTGVVSSGVLGEAARALAEKRPQALGRYQALITARPFLSVTVTPAQIVPYVRIVGSKDAHVVAAAVAGGADYLLSLDRPLLNRVAAAQLPLVALSPGRFIQTVLPTHPDYPSLG